MSEAEETIPNDINEQLNGLMQEKEKLINKNNELLDELKKFKRLREESDLEAKTKAEEAMKKAGDFEALYKSSMSKLEETQGRYDELLKANADKDRSIEARKIAESLADGENVEILHRFVMDRLGYDVDGIKVLDKSGQPTISTLDDLKKEFASNSMFKHVIRGNQASGGGAPEAINSGGAAKTMSRSEFEKLSQSDPVSAGKFFKDGGKIED